MTEGYGGIRWKTPQGLYEFLDRNNIESPVAVHLRALTEGTEALQAVLDDKPSNTASGTV